MKVLVVEDIELIREHLVSRLSEISEVDVVWDGPHDPRIAEITRETQADVVLINVLVGRAAQAGLAFRAVKELKQLVPKPVIIMLGDRHDSNYDAVYERQALKHGVDLYLDRAHEMETMPQLVKIFVENGLKH